MSQHESFSFCLCSSLCMQDAFSFGRLPLVFLIVIIILFGMLQLRQLNRELLEMVYYSREGITSVTLDPMLTTEVT